MLLFDQNPPSLEWLYDAQSYFGIESIFIRVGKLTNRKEDVLLRILVGHEFVDIDYLEVILNYS